MPFEATKIQYDTEIKLFLFVFMFRGSQVPTVREAWNAAPGCTTGVFHINSRFRAILKFNQSVVGPKARYAFGEAA
eukprot:SAG11_NODE_9728_length_885_cov_1.376590_2_plen_75_part_01